MQKFAFNNDAEYLSVSLGISDDRNTEIFEIVKESFRINQNPSSLMEAAINAAQPKNHVEAMYLGFVVSDILNKFKEFGQNPLAKLLEALRDR